MGALTGQIVQTLRDGAGAVAVETVVFFVAGTGALRDDTWTTSRGGQTGALIVDNLTGRAVRVPVRDAAGAELRAMAVPAAGLTRTVAQLAPLGVTSLGQLNGLTFDLA